MRELVSINPSVTFDFRTESFRFLFLFRKLFPSTPKEELPSDEDSTLESEPLRNICVADFFAFISVFAPLETGCFPLRVSRDFYKLSFSCFNCATQYVSERLVVISSSLAIVVRPHFLRRDLTSAWAASRS